DYRKHRYSPAHSVSRLGALLDFCWIFCRSQRRGIARVFCDGVPRSYERTVMGNTLRSQFIPGTTFFSGFKGRDGLEPAVCTFLLGLFIHGWQTPGTIESAGVDASRSCLSRLSVTPLGLAVSHASRSRVGVFCSFGDNDG